MRFNTHQEFLAYNARPDVQREYKRRRYSFLTFILFWFFIMGVFGVGGLASEHVPFFANIHLYAAALGMGVLGLYGMRVCSKVVKELNKLDREAVYG